MPAASTVSRTLRAGLRAGTFRRGGVPALIATAVAAGCAALGAARPPAPADAPLAALGPASQLVLALIVGLAWVMTWHAERDADDADIFGVLVARGASAAQCWYALVAGLVPAALLCLAGGWVATGTLAFGARAPDQVLSPQALGWAAAEVLVTVAGLVAAAAGGRMAGWRASPTHFRSAAQPARGPLAGSGWAIAALMTGVALAWAGRHMPPRLAPALDGGVVLVLWGAARLGERVLSALLTIPADRPRGAGPALGVQWAARAAARGRLLTAPALILGVSACLLVGAVQVARADRLLLRVAVGSQVQLPLQWLPPCYPLRPCADPAAVGPPDAQTLVAHLPGVTAGSVLITAPDVVRTIGGIQPVALYGIDPATFAAAIPLRVVPGATQALHRMEATGDGVIVSRQLARRLQLHVGDRLRGHVVPSMQVAAILPRWPALGPTATDWIVLPWETLAHGLEVSGTFGSHGMLGAALLDTRPGASIRQLTIHLTESLVAVNPDTVRANPGGGGFGALQFLILPALAGLAWTRWPTPPREDALVLAALGAEEVTAAGRRWTCHLQAWTAGAFGLAVGAVAAALYWPLAVPRALSAAGWLAWPWWALAAAGLLGLAAWIALGGRANGRRIGRIPSPLPGWRPRPGTVGSPLQIRAWRHARPAAMASAPGASWGWPCAGSQTRQDTWWVWRRASCWRPPSPPAYRSTPAPH